MNFPPIIFHNEKFPSLFPQSHSSQSQKQSSSLYNLQNLYKKLLKFENKEQNFEASVISWIKSLDISQLIKYFSFKNNWLVNILHELILISDSKPYLKFKFIPGPYLQQIEKEPEDNNNFNFLNNINNLYYSKESKFSNFFNIVNDGLIQLTRGKSDGEIKRQELVDNIRYLSLNLEESKNIFDNYNNVVTLSYNYLKNIDKLISTFQDISNKNCFKYPLEIETISLSYNNNTNNTNSKKNYYNIKMPKWLKNEFTFSELICAYFEQSILVNYMHEKMFQKEITGLYYEEFDELIDNNKKLVEFIKSRGEKKFEILKGLQPDKIKKIINSQDIKDLISLKTGKDNDIRNSYIGRYSYAKKHTMKTIINNCIIILEKIFIRGELDFVLFLNFFKDNIIFTTDDFVIKTISDMVNNYWKEKAAEDLLNDLNNENSNNNNNDISNKKKKKKRRKKKEIIEENNNNEINNEDIDNENNNEIKDNENEEEKNDDNNNNIINNDNNEINDLEKEKINDKNKEILNNIIINEEENNYNKNNEDNKDMNPNNNSNNINENVIKEDEENIILNENDEDINENKEEKNNNINDEDKEIKIENEENIHKKKKEKDFFLYPTVKDKKKKNKQKNKKVSNIMNNNNIEDKIEIISTDKETISNDNNNIIIINDKENEKEKKEEKESEKENSDKKNNKTEYLLSKQKNKFNMGMKLKKLMKDNTNLIIPKNFHPRDNSNINLNNITSGNLNSKNFLKGTNLPHFTSFNFQSKKKRNYRNKNNINNNSNNMNIFPYNFVSKNIIEFSQEIIDNTIKVNKNKKLLQQIREKYIKKIYENINIFLRNIKVEFMCAFYGSSVSGLSIENSDIDIMVKLRKNYDNKNYIKNIMEILVENLKKSELNYIININPILSASVPVIKLDCDLCNDESFFKEINNLMNKYNINYNDISKLYFDITFFETSNELEKIPSELMIDYIKECLMLYPQIYDIVYIMKKFLFNKKLNKSYQGGISSYSLFLLTLAFIKSNKNNFDIPIGSLFIEFLNFYSNFDFYDTLIKPNEENNIFENFENNQKFHLNIIDPITGLNVAKSTFKMDSIQMAFREGLDIICSNLFEKNINNEINNINNTQEHKKILDNFFAAK